MAGRQAGCRGRGGDQVLEQPINIQAGKCYSVVGAGMGITELHIQIVAQPTPMVPPVVLAQDNGGSGRHIVIGRRNQPSEHRANLQDWKVVARDEKTRTRECLSLVPDVRADVDVSNDAGQRAQFRLL